MKKRTLKKFLLLLVMVFLFSSTVVYAKLGEYSYSYTLNQTQTVYTDLVIKQEDEDYAHIEPISLNGTFRVTVVNSYNNAKSYTDSVKPTTIWLHLHYNGKAVPGDSVKLKIHNYPADNAGRIRSIQGIWIP
ncbi:MAG: hypothetical protein IJO60_06330 [Agathobacter sp.]|nr:hypothetical protein [Agathobacter sp.]